MVKSIQPERRAPQENRRLSWALHVAKYYKLVFSEAGAVKLTAEERKAWAVLKQRHVDRELAAYESRHQIPERF